MLIYTQIKKYIQKQVISFPSNTHNQQLQVKEYLFAHDHRENTFNMKQRELRWCYEENYYIIQTVRIQYSTL